MQILGIRNSNLVSLRASPFSNIHTSARSTEVAQTVLNAPPASSNTLVNSFLNSPRTAPTVELGSAVAGFRANDSFEFLKDQFKISELHITENLQNRTDTGNLRSDFLQDIKSSLENLASSVSRLQKPGSLNTRLASSSRPTLVEANATANSSFGTFSVTPQRTAAGNILVSDQQNSDLGPLDFAGSFILNGFQVTVESSDTLVDIRNKINFGEDTNGNGVLDPAEDRNENEISETLQVSPSEFGPGVFIIEDINGNGTLDPAEDVNENYRLDGGTGETNVIASIQSDRLVLTSLTAGASIIDLQDDDSILLSMGFFELNAKNQPIVKEQQIDFSFNPPRNLNQNPRTALIDLDGTRVANNTNSFSNAITGTRLDIKQASPLQAKIRVFTDANQAAGQIKTFVDTFNGALKNINNALRSSPLFARDQDIQRIRQNLLDNSQQEFRRIDAGNRAIDKVRGNRENHQNIGLENFNVQKNTIQEVALTRAVQTIKDGITSPFKNNGGDLLRRLSSFGIRTESDDTMRVDEPQLKRALTVNPDVILDLFNNPETGLLPRLDQELPRILKTDLGDIDLKQNELRIQSGVPSQLAGKFQRFFENTTFDDTVQNLIAVA